MTNNYVKLSTGRVHFFDDRNRLGRTVALGHAQCDSTAVVWRRPDGNWAQVREVGDGPQWTDEERAASEN